MTCESCGANEDELAPVHRKYVTPGDGEQDETVRVLSDVERWCVSCLTQYPHVPAEA